MPKETMELVEDTVTKYGKSDLERLGLFIEMPYMHGKRYAFPKMQQVKGLNMLSGGPKSKCGTMDGYFDDTFMRLFEGERPPKRQPGKKSDKTPFVPIGPSKLHSTSGDYYGTFFTEPCEYFSRVTVKVAKPKKTTVEATFITSPAKKGGPGYPNICLNKYPEHMSDRITKKPKKTVYTRPPMCTVHYPQPYFEVNPYKEPEGATAGPVYMRPKEKAVAKKQGPFIPYGYNKLDGYFHKFPERTADKYVSQYEVNKRKRTPEIFVPPMQNPKSQRYSLTIDQMTRRGLNATTLQTYKPSFIKYLM